MQWTHRNATRADLPSIVEIYNATIPCLELFGKSGFARWGELPGVTLLDGVERDVIILGRKVANAVCVSRAAGMGTDKKMPGNRAWQKVLHEEFVLSWNRWRPHGLLTWVSVDPVVDHDALVVAGEAEVDALLARRFSQAGHDPAHHNCPTRYIRIPGA